MTAGDVGRMVTVMGPTVTVMGRIVTAMDRIVMLPSWGLSRPRTRVMRVRGVRLKVTMSSPVKVPLGYFACEDNAWP